MAKDTLFQGVQCLGDAKNLMHEHNAVFASTFQFTYPERNSYHMLKDKGIHIYFMDCYGRDIGYYTPIMETLCIFQTARNVDPNLLTKGERKYD